MITKEWLRKICHIYYFDKWGFRRDIPEQPYMELEVHRIKKAKYLISLRQGDIHYVSTKQELLDILKALKFTVNE